MARLVIEQLNIVDVKTFATGARQVKAVDLNGGGEWLFGVRKEDTGLAVPDHGVFGFEGSIKAAIKSGTMPTKDNNGNVIKEGSFDSMRVDLVAAKFVPMKIVPAS